jgi:DNA-binding response OmpR family regulator
MTAETKALRVLIVDNERVIADTLAFIVEASGHRARKAYDGMQATIVAEAFHPHAVISDVMMPGMDGFELADWLEEHHPESRVLLVSGHTDTTERLEAAMLAGRSRTVLPKPVHPTEILRFLSTCTGEMSEA